MLDIAIPNNTPTMKYGRIGRLYAGVELSASDFLMP